MQSNNSIMSNNQMSQQHQHHHQQLQQQLQQHLSGGYMSNGMSGSGVGGSGNVVGNNIMLSELPEPPISVSEIGPIPPPPMFSTPSPTMVAGRPHGPGVHGMSHHDYDYDGELRNHRMLESSMIQHKFFLSIQMMTRKNWIRMRNIIHITTLTHHA